MASAISFFLFLSSLTLICIAKAQERSPHGLAYENPVDISPSAYEFFHPKTENLSLEGSLPLPLAAQVESSEAQESKYFGSERGSEQINGGKIAGTVLGVALAGTLVMGVYYVFRSRLANMSKSNSNSVQVHV